MLQTMEPQSQTLLSDWTTVPAVDQVLPLVAAAVNRIAWLSSCSKTPDCRADLAFDVLQLPEASLNGCKTDFSVALQD